MGISWKWLNLCLGLLLFQLCNGFPINLEDSVADQHTQLLTGLVAVLLTVCSVVFLAGCLCCRRRNGFKQPEELDKEFRDSPVLASAASDLDHGHVNPIANGEFTIFTPLSSSPYNNSVFLANERIITRTAEDFIYEDFDVSSWFNESEKDFPRINLKYIKELGKGWFGKVVEGAAKEIPPNEEAWSPVVVRILDATASRKERVLFLNDAAIYRCEAHPNILSLIGRCLDTVPLLLLQEYCPQGDLKSYLRSKKENVEQLLCTDHPLLWCCQLTSALKHLHSNRVTHPDLATRNCQLTANLTLKLGDYGLAETKYPEDYYQGSPRVPVRWCSPESLTCTPTTIQPKKHTTESNIWSLGVTIWEICECGKQPYSNLSDDEVVSQVLGPPNLRLSRPSFQIFYTDYLYRLMQMCWFNAESRPTVTQIDLMLSDLWQVYKNTKTSALATDDFDRRWESFGPKPVSEESAASTITKPLSPSLSNLHGSLEDLLESGQLEGYLEMSSSESSDRPSPKQRKSKLKSSSGNFNQPCSLSNAAQRTSSESETEDENWRKKVERGAYTEKVRLKSRSVADLMILTHVDYSESDTETPLPSLDYRVNYKNVRYAPKSNLENTGLTYGSEGNLLSVHDTFQEELKKLKEERRDSLLFVPDNHSQTNSNKLGDNSSAVEDSSDQNPVFNVFTVDKCEPISVNSCKLGGSQPHVESIEESPSANARKTGVCDTNEERISDFVNETYQTAPTGENLDNTSTRMDLNRPMEQQSKNTEANPQMGPDFFGLAGNLAKETSPGVCSPQINENEKIVEAVNDVIINNACIASLDTNFALSDALTSDIENDSKTVANEISKKSTTCDQNLKSENVSTEAERMLEMDEPKLVPEIFGCQELSESCVAPNDGICQFPLQQVEAISESEKSESARIEDDTNENMQIHELDETHCNPLESKFNLDTKEFHDNKDVDLNETDVNQPSKERNCSPESKDDAILICNKYLEGKIPMADMFKLLIEGEIKWSDHLPESNKPTANGSVDSQMPTILEFLNNGTVTQNKSISDWLYKNRAQTGDILESPFQDLKISAEEFFKSVPSEEFLNNISEQVPNSKSDFSIVPNILEEFTSPPKFGSDTEEVSEETNTSKSLENLELHQTFPSKDIDLNETDMVQPNQILRDESLEIHPETPEERNTFHTSQSNLLSTINTLDNINVQDKVIHVDEIDLDNDSNIEISNVNNRSRIVHVGPNTDLDVEIYNFQDKDDENEDIQTHKINNVSESKPSSDIVEMNTSILLKDQELYQAFQSKDVDLIKTDMDEPSKERQSSPEPKDDAIPCDELLEDEIHPYSIYANEIGVDSYSDIGISFNAIEVDLTNDSVGEIYFKDQEDKNEDIQTHLLDEGKNNQESKSSSNTEEISEETNTSKSLENQELHHTFQSEDVDLNKTNMDQPSKEIKFLPEPKNNAVICNEFLQSEIRWVNISETPKDKNSFQTSKKYEWDASTANSLDEQAKDIIDLNEIDLITDLDDDESVYLNAEDIDDLNEVIPIKISEDNQEKNNVQVSEESESFQNQLRDKSVTENVDPNENCKQKFQEDLKNEVIPESNSAIEDVPNITEIKQCNNCEVPNTEIDFKCSEDGLNCDEISSNKQNELGEQNESHLPVSDKDLESKDACEQDTKKEENTHELNGFGNSNQEQVVPNVIDQPSVFTSTPSKDRKWNCSASNLSVNLFDAREENKDEQNSGLSPLDTSKNLNYSLETWDNFLGRTLDAQDIQNENLFDSFSSEPHSLLFVENGNELVQPHERSDTKNEDEDKINDRTFVIEDKNDNTFIIENSELSDENKDKSAEAESEMEDAVDNSAWGSGGGWFLHPQTSTKEPSGTIEVRESTGSYVGFGIDDEVMAAIRNELLNKLPHAQVAPSEKVTEMEEWDSAEKNEVFLKYNIYNPPLSPILEESYVEDLEIVTPKQESDNEESEWSEHDLPETLPVEPESHTYDSQLKGPHHRHTPSQDSCCSNDTLFNLEELTCAEKENDPTKNEPEPEKDGNEKPAVEEKCTQEPIDLNAEEVTETNETNVENNSEGLKNATDQENIACDVLNSNNATGEEDKVINLSKSVKTEDNSYVGEFISQEIEHSSKQHNKSSDNSNSDPNSSQEECPIAFKKTQVAPLPSPEDNPWKQLPASLLSYDKVTSQNNSLLLPPTKSNNAVPEPNDLPDDKPVAESQPESLSSENVQPVYENEVVREPDYENVPVYENVTDIQPVYENVKDSQAVYQNFDVCNEVDYVNIVNLENSKNSADYTKDKDYICVESDENKTSNESGKTDDIYGMLTDIKFNGPTDNQLISTSFSESNDINDEQDWDSGSDTRSSSSGEFIWKEGEHEESLKALRAAPQDVLETVRPMEGITEESTDESDVSGSTSDEEGEVPEFVPSAWDKFATPTKSALRSPEKTLEKSEKNKSKGVWFKKQKYHCVYEYPREPESPVLQSQDLWKPQLDYSSFTDWEFDADTYFPTSTVDDNDATFPSAYNYQPKTISSRNLYQLTSISDYIPSNDEFFVSSSARPFDATGNLSSQFFPGSGAWTGGENATPDSGVEDTTPGSSTELNGFKTSDRIPVESLKCLASEAVKKTKQTSVKSDSLGGLRHTRNKLKLDLPPSPSAFTSTKMFMMEPSLEPVIREKPTFTTFGKSRFSVQHVDTPPDESKNKNVSFEALPYKPMKEEGVKSEKFILKDKLDCGKGHSEYIRGEASLLDSADEDSGIESSTLERKMSSEALSH